MEARQPSPQLPRAAVVVATDGGDGASHVLSLLTLVTSLL